jgi:hypothetical protein
VRHPKEENASLKAAVAETILGSQRFEKVRGCGSASVILCFLFAAAKVTVKAAERAVSSFPLLISRKLQHSGTSSADFTRCNSGR